jgi:hypothetical protein
MALAGLQPYESPNVYDNVATGQEGRDPGNWGTPNDPSHGTLGAGDTVTPATGFTMAPGDEFAFGDVDAYLAGDYHGRVLDTTPINPPGFGESVPVPVTGYLTPADERHWAYEAELVQAHSEDLGGPLRARHVNPLAQGGNNDAAWQMRATDRGSTYNDNGSLVSMPGSGRPALDLYRYGDESKMLKGPVVGYGERPMLNNIAAVAAQSEAPRSILSPSNRPDPFFAAVNPGPGVVYQSPPDPQIIAATTSTEVMGGLEWMTYG